MKRILSIVIGVIVIVSLVVLGFTLEQIYEQQNSLSADLQYRTKLLADSFKESVEPYYLSKSTDALQKLLDKFADRQRLLGLVVYDNKGNVIASSADLSKDIVNHATIASQAMDADKELGGLIKVGGVKLYEYAEPLRRDRAVLGALMVVQRADYIDSAIQQTWKSNLLRLLVQALLFSLAVIFILRWLIFKPIMAMAESMKLTRSGQLPQDLEVVSGHAFFRPLAEEISKMSKSLFKARSAASEEARLRMQKLDTPWTADRLKEHVKTYLKDRKIFVVSNREPYVHTKNKNEITYSVPASGMVTAIEPMMEACGGMWLAHGSGNADKLTVDNQDKIQAPPEEPKYTLKRVWLTEKEQKGYYTGFSNETLWPLCHTCYTRPIFRKEDWQEYRKVNGKFAQSLLAEFKNIQRPLVLVQDFHLALLPQMVKKSRPDAQVALFWHIPWPNAENFSICPWRKEILEGMLGADVLGFHTQQHCNNFMETVGKEIESVVDLEQFLITHNGHITYIKTFPISVAFTDSNNKKKEKLEKADTLLDKLGVKTKYIALGVDRLDYTKGILERFKGIEFFFELYPAYKKQFTFLQIAPPSREGVEKYRQFNEDVTNEAERINEKLSAGDWKPIILIKEHFSHEDIYPLYRRVNACLVTSLHDGMNLVSKEFVSARDDEAGVLILSQFTGASRDLKGAIMINPYSAEQTASAIYEALNMSPSEQHRRMKKMREAVKNYNVYRWAAELIKAVASIG